MPSSLKNDNKNGNSLRNAYISFGILGNRGGIDTGIRNNGSGWHPCYYDMPYGNFVPFENDIASSEITIVGIEIEVKPQKEIIFSLTYRNSNFDVIQSFQKKLDGDRAIDEDDNGNPIFRFYRFASLVPLKEDDQNDGTYMKDGKFTGLTIVRDNNAQSWGISENDIEFAWKVSPSRIELDYTENSDSFSIIHKEKEDSFSILNEGKDKEEEIYDAQSSGVKNLFIYMYHYIIPIFSLFYFLYVF